MVVSALEANVLPEPGQLVHVRSRRWLVETVEPRGTGESPLIRLACADDDAQGQMLDVFWDYEIDRKILDEEGWANLATQGFDPPRYFSAFLHTLRWNCVTSTDSALVQSPFRAGIKLEAYQIEPLRKALQLPLVNLFIADDTGLGKTIEAGLIARELLLRKKVETIVVSAPPSVLDQWKAELEERFGLVFEILDRQYLSRMRRDRGFGVNPWRTHSRFLVSHNLLTDPTYADPLRERLGDRLHGSLLILDEAHHAAPSSGGSYGIESKFTRAIRDISGRFEHRLFLSATPHNGHSSSFSTLLELLDPHRFTRGVAVSEVALKEVMVRRLKEDIRQIQGGFPQRRVEPITIKNLPPDAPELVLSELLDEYRSAREQRLANRSVKAKASAALLVIGLQQRLLSSVEAFARSLAVHRNTAERQRREALDSASEGSGIAQLDQALITGTQGPDDESSRTDDDALQAEEDSQFRAVTLESEAGATSSVEEAAQWERELALLDRMEVIAKQTRSLPDAKVRWLLDWIRDNMCPIGQSASGPDSSPAKWNERRILIFTENRQGTKRYLRETIDRAIEGTDQCYDRIEVIDGLTSSSRRREIQRRFNTPPAEDPLRILLATDAAREGLNFQAHCADLFHYDLPWNPGRIEQRNGRIDRKLQPAPVVHCRYFVLPQRREDRVLEVLVRKTETIRKELGSLATVIDDAVERTLLRDGIRHSKVHELERKIQEQSVRAEGRRRSKEELDSATERYDELQRQIESCRKVLQRSRSHVRFDAEQFRKALSCSLELLGADPLTEQEDSGSAKTWSLPALDRRATTDPSWTTTLDTLRSPRKRNQKISDWRREAPIRRVVFEDEGVLSDATVHLHLEQRLAQRLLSRFRAQGFVHHDLSRACLAQTADSVPRVVLLGRLLLFGRRAERLHEEIVPVAARWIEPARRSHPLEPFGKAAEAKTLDLLDQSLGRVGGRIPSETVRSRLLAAAPLDIEELQGRLDQRAKQAAVVAESRLAERGQVEEEKLAATLKEQRKRVQAELARQTDAGMQLGLQFSEEEKVQIEANIRVWRRRIDAFDRDIEAEPARVRELYQVATRRVEPVGLVYLWPDTN